MSSAVGARSTEKEDDELPPPPAAADAAPAAEEAEATPAPQPQHKNLIRLCGSAWAPCGYCKGKRSHLAQKPAPAPVPVAAAPCSKAEEQEQQFEKQPAATPKDIIAEPEAPAPILKMEEQVEEDKEAISVEEEEEEENSSKDTTDAYTSKAYSILATNLTPACYEGLIDSGWRRSGSAVYKPGNFVSCCPQLSIRLRASAYHPTRSQARVARRMNNLLLNNNKSGKEKQKKPRSASSHAAKTDGDASSLVCAVVEEWQDRTRAALDEILQEKAVQLPPVKYKLQPKTANKRGRAAAGTAKHNNDNTIVLMTTACAAIAGRSKGSIDRSQLAQQLVQKLLQQQKSTTTANNESNPPTDAPQQQPTVTCHSASGQVFVQLPQQQPPDLEMSEADECDTLMNGHGSSSKDTIAAAAATTTSNHSSSGGNRLSAWLRAHTGLTSMDPPYQLDIITVPAHESALDPQVHRLYWEYQHAVHQDPNPFDMPVVSPSSSCLHDDDDLPNKNNDNKDSPDARMEEMTTAAPALEGHEVSGDDWGREYAPRGWRELADRMLETEYAHLPVERQQQLKRSYASFYEFLVENPFVVDNESKSRRNSAASASRRRATPKLGTYHQHYKISGNILIAVGVVDILPTGLSSVYLFYNPSFAHDLVPLGKYAILKEIEWTAKANLPYYYLGYYIESCHKMKYKGDYYPSELLCPKTYRWVDAEVAKKTLLRESPEHHCCTLYKEEADEEKNHGGSSGSSSSKRSRTQPPLPLQGGETVVDRIPMEIGAGMLVTIGMLQPEGQDLVRPLLQEFSEQVGPAMAVQCVVNLR